jgi:hypothetical protein
MGFTVYVYIVHITTLTAQWAVYTPRFMSIANALWNKWAHRYVFWWPWRILHIPEQRLGSIFVADFCSRGFPCIQSHIHIYIYKYTVLGNSEQEFFELSHYVYICSNIICRYLLRWTAPQGQPKTTFWKPNVFKWLSEWYLKLVHAHHVGFIR